jgi:hypothetical protein
LFETNLNNQIFDKVKEERVPDVVSWAHLALISIPNILSKDIDQESIWQKQTDKEEAMEA